jgi:CheY-like chemotaxis protein
MAKVLVVDDEHSQAEILLMLLSLEGFEVVVASNGKEALAQLDRVQPDLIVTDYMMPLMNGGEMAKLVRAAPLHSKVPIVMTSATDAEQVEQHAEHYDAFLRKPYLWNDLFAIIRRLLAPLQGT